MGLVMACVGLMLGLLPRDKCFVLRSCCWEGKGGGERRPLFYYSEVHFNLHKRRCVCDGWHRGKNYSPGSPAKGEKNKSDLARIKNSALWHCILIRGWGLGRPGRGCLGWKVPGRASLWREVWFSCLWPSLSAFDSPLPGITTISGSPSWELLGQPL